MLYDATLTKAESSLLASFVNQRLERLIADGWSAQLHFGTSIVEVLSQEIAAAVNEFGANRIQGGYVNGLLQSWEESNSMA